jgi:predicted transposase YbfD/YdcC
MEKTYKIVEYFKNIETTKEHNGYTFNVWRALLIVILGSLCGLENLSSIHHWAKNEKVKEFLWEKFDIIAIPSYYWFTSLLNLIKPESLNDCFIKWVQFLISEKNEGSTVSFDGKTVRSTGKMQKYENPLHIVSAQLANLGITIGQKAVESKSNEIPAVRDLIKLLDINGCMIVADALNCQTKTAKVIIEGGGDYLLNVKDNQEALKEDIEDYVQDTELRGTMDKASTVEINRDRIERRTAYTTEDIDWIEDKGKWEKLACIGAINRQFIIDDKKTNEWHYYISSRPLSAEELLKHARMEWSVESMHWLLDIHYNEDLCRVENRNVQENLNMARKIALNCIRNYKTKTNSGLPFSKFFIDCMVDSKTILSILDICEV